ncbi:14382_t:CDS:2, partial [Cetraspora pellucida]
PQKRPTANEIYLRLYHLWSYIYNSKKIDKLHIKEKFMAADKIIKTLPEITRHHPDSMYTSRIIITKELFKGNPETTKEDVVDIDPMVSGYNLEALEIFDKDLQTLR